MSEYQYNKVTPEMIEKFKEIAPKRVLVGDEINEDFTHDEMAIYGKARPEVLVEATSTEEVAAVVKLCNENKVPVELSLRGADPLGAEVCGADRRVCEEARGADAAAGDGFREPDLIDWRAEVIDKPLAPHAERLPRLHQGGTAGAVRAVE